MKEGSFFLGTVAFLEPEHGNSYFHMTKRGISQIFKEGALKEIAIEPIEGWNVLTSMKIFPIPGMKYYNRFKSKIIFSIRSLLIRLRLLTLKGERKERGIIRMEGCSRECTLGPSCSIWRRFESSECSSDNRSCCMDR